MTEYSAEDLVALRQMLEDERAIIEAIKLDVAGDFDATAKLLQDHFASRFANLMAAMFGIIRETLNGLEDQIGLDLEKFLDNWITVKEESINKIDNDK